jgi:hypothetical protein
MAYSPAVRSTIDANNTDTTVIFNYDLIVGA